MYRDILNHIYITQYTYKYIYIYSVSINSQACPCPYNIILMLSAPDSHARWKKGVHEEGKILRGIKEREGGFLCSPPFHEGEGMQRRGAFN